MCLAAPDVHCRSAPEQGPAPDGLGELAAFVVPDVAGWGAHQPRHTVLLLILPHVDPHLCRTRFPLTTPHLALTWSSDTCWMVTDHQDAAASKVTILSGYVMHCLRADSQAGCSIDKQGCLYSDHKMLQVYWRCWGSGGTPSFSRRQTAVQQVPCTAQFSPPPWAPATSATHAVIIPSGFARATCRLGLCPILLSAR